jgi:cytochrome c5
MKAIFGAIVLVVGMSFSNLAAAGGDAKAGEVVFNHACKLCHGPGIMGAPKVGNKAAWSARIQEGEAQLTDHALLGYHNMPPRGDCKTCSDQDIANAVAYMANQVK